mgnify:CR=1 FL=1
MQAIPLRWRILICLFLARTALGFQFQVVGSVSNQMSASLGFSYTEIGTLIGFFILPGLILAFPAGWLGRWFQDRTSNTAGLLLMAAGGVLAALSASFYGIAGGRLLMGVGFVICSVYFTKKVVDWFSGHELATAMSLLVISWPGGIALSQLSHSWMAEAHGWPLAMWSTVSSCLFSALLIWLVYRAPPNAPGSAAAKPVEWGLERKEWWLIGISAFAWGVFNAGYIVFLSFAAQSLVTPDQTILAATALVSIASWIAMVAIPAGGIIADRTKRPDLVVYFAMGLGILSMVTLPMAGWAIPSALLFGAAGIMPAGVLVAMTGRAVAPERRAFGMGVYYIGYFFFCTVSPIMAGWLFDQTGDARDPLLLAMALFALTAISYRAFDVAERRL